MCAALRAGGATISLLDAPLPYSKPSAPVAAVLRWLIPGRGFGRAHRSLHRHFTQKMPDCFYSHFLHTHLICGVVGRKLGIPRIGHVHGTMNPRRWYGLTRLAYSCALARSVNRIIMVSRTAEDSLTAHVRRQARLVYNGINVERIETAAAGVSKIPGKLILLGRIVRGKKIDVAIRAMAALMQSGVQCRLDVIGGPLDETNLYGLYLRRLVRDLKVDDRVAFTGPIHPPYERLAAAEILVNCSTVEGLPYTIMESMLCRTPVIVADRGAPTEMVEHELAGLHFKADDPDSLAGAVARLLGDQGLRERLAENALVYARRTFDISTHMRAIRAVFDETVSLRSCGGRAGTSPASM